MSVKCGDCKNFKKIDEKSGLGVCKLNIKDRVLDITPANNRINCKYDKKRTVDEV